MFWMHPKLFRSFLLHYLTNMECPWPDLVEWEFINFHGADTFVCTINYRSRNRHRNLWGRRRVSPWWTLLWFGYIYELCVSIRFIFGCPFLYNFYLDVWLMGYVICIQMSNWWRKGWTVAVLYQMSAIIIQYEVINVWATVYAFVRLPRMFLSTDFLFEKRMGLVNIHPVLDNCTICSTFGYIWLWKSLAGFGVTVSHDTDVRWGRWRLKSPVSRLFTQSFVQVQIKENIKAPRHWPLRGEFTGDQWIPRTKCQ